MTEVKVSQEMLAEESLPRARVCNDPINWSSYLVKPFVSRTPPVTPTFLFGGQSGRGVEGGVMGGVKHMAVQNFSRLAGRLLRCLRG
jgi:hypothetical protein